MMKNKKILDNFMNDVKKVFEKYLERKDVSLKELINSADLFVDTLEKEMKKWKKEKK
mgnify:FL=1